MSGAIVPTAETSATGLKLICDRLEAEARALLVLDDASLVRATTLVATIAALEKRTDAERRTWTDPLNAQVKRLNEMFRGVLDHLRTSRDIVSPQITRYITAQRAEADRALHEAEDAAARTGIAAPAAGKGLVNVETGEVVEAAGKTSRSAAGSATVRRYWRGRVVDPLLVPREYLVVDQGAIDRVMQATHGQAHIPGVEAYSTESLAVRPAGAGVPGPGR